MGTDCPCTGRQLRVTDMAALQMADRDSPPASDQDDWHLLRIQHCVNARGRLIERYMPFARMLAAKLYAKRVIREAEFDDYRHWGIEGLIEAIDRFDPAHGAPFEPFASRRIVGSILNRVDSLSDKAAQISMRARIKRERAQSVAESISLGTDTTTLFNRLAEIAVGLALGLMLEDTGMIQPSEEATTKPDVYCSIELEQLRKRIHALVEMLPTRERSLIKYHYYFSFSFEQIAEHLSITKGRVSQLHRQALKRLRDLQKTTGSLELLI